MKISHMIISSSLVSCRTVSIFADDILAIQCRRRQPANHFPSTTRLWTPYVCGYNDVEYEIMPWRYSVSQKKEEKEISLCQQMLYKIDYYNYVLWALAMGTDPCVYVTLGVNIVSIFPFSIISVIYTLIRLKLTLHARRNPFFSRLPLSLPPPVIKSAPKPSPISALHLLTYNFKLPAYSGRPLSLPAVLWQFDLRLIRIQRKRFPEHTKSQVEA